MRWSILTRYGEICSPKLTHQACKISNIPGRIRFLFGPRELSSPEYAQERPWGGPEYLLIEQGSYIYRVFSHTVENDRNLRALW
jgi:hypothetical protein